MKLNQLMVTMKMNTKKIEWARRYKVGLRKHLAQNTAASLQLALGLGNRAVALGFEPLDLALIHEKNLATLLTPEGSPRSRQKTTLIAKDFYTHTIIPIEKTHQAALDTTVQVNQLTRKLKRRTLESSASTRRLERCVTRRKQAEAALKKSGKHRIQLLQESSRLHHRLRVHTREILKNQENVHRKTSHKLHDEIAQTLLAINLRLLTLKKSSKTTTEKLKKEIAETQRLVQKSKKPIRRVAHKINVYHET